MINHYYFDNNATTVVAPEVLECMSHFLSVDFLNPSAPYPQSKAVQSAILVARERIASLLGISEPSRVFFTGSGSEANSWAILGSIDKIGLHDFEFVTSSVEHSSVSALAEHLMQKGVKTEIVRVDQQGQICLNSLMKCISDKTKLVSLQYVNSETGVIQPIEKIVQAIKSFNNNILIHVDAVQAAGKIPLSLEDLPVDFLSISAHKFHGPKGVGALYIAKNSSISPLIYGGKQESGLRGGTENVVGIVGMGKAAELASSHLSYLYTETKVLRDLVETALLKNVPNAVLHGSKVNRVPTTTYVAIPGVENMAMIAQMSAKGILISSGSACSSGTLTPSKTLLAMGVSEDLAWSSLRISLSRYTSKEEVDILCESLISSLTKLKTPVSS